ncbi:MAG: aminotransferase class V-fold PLP-dependent enzyme [Coleofasciculus sp. B1-GNL1-01]|uniref:aminotransferase class V-fold PLP-dependent enzyme n=1 Tax=Coleofasciculus sp. B1-GNL1-01 TaxID=3068484 RepID=UPI0032FBC50F
MLKVYPRLNLDIRFSDIILNLLSFLTIPDREKQTHEIQSFWQSKKEVIVTLSVRTSLDLLLQSLNLPAGSEVLMSAVNIRDMVEIVKRHGLIPVPVDISLDTLAPSLELLEDQISERSRLFIIAHLFGAITNLAPYAKLCRKHNILLIEDCAQAFAGSKYYGYPDADISFFSFGSIKSCTALGGAVALVGDKQLARQIKSIEQQYPVRSETWFFKRLLKYLGLKFFSIPLIYGTLIACLKLLNQDVDRVINSLTRGFSQGDILTNIRYRPPRQMLSLLNRRLRICNHHHFEQRRFNGQRFLSLLPSEIICPGRQAEYHSFWVFPILVPNPELLMTQLRVNGFDTTRGTTSLTCIDRSYDKNQLPAVYPLQGKRLIDQVLYLPVAASFSDKELQDLAELVNQFI